MIIEIINEINVISPFGSCPPLYEPQVLFVFGTLVAGVMPLPHIYHFLYFVVKLTV